MSVIISGSTDIGYKTNTSNLLLYLDAGNPNSYPGYGDIWYDLSPKVNNSNIPPSTVYTSDSSSFYVNGTNGSFVRFDVPQILTSTNPITVELIFKRTQVTIPFGVVFGFQFYNLMINGGSLSYNTGNGVFQSVIGFSPQLDTWYHLVCEMYQDPIPKDGNNKIWINGVNYALASAGGAITGQDFNGGTGRIADAFGWGSNYNSVGYYPIFKIYKGTLTQQEITNNYNNYKTRYPLS
jgi:hypothetical protein